MNAQVNPSFDHTPLTKHDLFGQNIAARLDEGTSALPYDISERLRAARVRALGERSRVQVQEAAAEVQAHAGGAALLGGPPLGLGFLGRFASIFPLLALVAGVVFIDAIQDDVRAREIAEVDSELLTNDLPPAAYLDPGFAQFLRVNVPDKGQ